MRALIVREPFTRDGVLHKRGAIFAKGEKVAELEQSDHAHHLVAVDLPDHHDEVRRQNGRKTVAEEKAEAEAAEHEKGERRSPIETAAGVGLGEDPPREE